MAVAVHNNNVSINTDNICTSPCLTGWLTTADAAAFGAEPIPASLEYRPLRIPCIMADPAKPAKMALKSNCISVVGSRTNTNYGEKWCKKFVKEFINYGVTIVSGMALGIDKIAHESAINNGGTTIAVMPSGFNNIYPKENLTLYEQIILSGGCVITEYNPNEKASSKKFLERNRIVSGISIATIVVEAAYRSGTSVTAKLANEQERDVYCIPGSLDNPKSIGTNKLIKEFAKIVLSPNDVLENYKFLHKNDKIITTNIQSIQKEYEEIYENITDIPISTNEIAKKINADLKEIISKLTMLELDGKIRKIAGDRYIRSE